MYSLEKVEGIVFFCCEERIAVLTSGTLHEKRAGSLSRAVCGKTPGWMLKRVWRSRACLERRGERVRTERSRDGGDTAVC